MTSQNKTAMTEERYVSEELFFYNHMRPKVKQICVGHILGFPIMKAAWDFEGTVCEGQLKYGQDPSGNLHPSCLQECRI